MVAEGSALRSQGSGVGGRGSGVGGPGSVVGAAFMALAAVLPLLAPEVWTGFRLAFSDPFLSVIAQTEQPLSVRSPGGVWAMALAVGWFGLAYWQRGLRCGNQSWWYWAAP